MIVKYTYHIISQRHLQNNVIMSSQQQCSCYDAENWFFASLTMMSVSNLKINRSDYVVYL